MNIYREKLKKYPVHEWTEAGFLLCFLGGFLDAYTFVSRGGVFANAQTGNLILLTLGLARGDGAAALRYLVPILFFFAGVICSRFFLRSERADAATARGRAAILIVEAAALAVAAALPPAVPDHWVTALVALAAALQFDSFRRLEGMAFATAFCTGNLRSTTEAFFRLFARRERAALACAVKYCIVLAGFVGGVLAGYFATAAWSNFSAFFCSGLLIFLSGMLLLGDGARRRLSDDGMSA